MLQIPLESDPLVSSLLFGLTMIPFYEYLSLDGEALIVFQMSVGI